MKRLREEVLDWVARTIAKEWPHEPSPHLLAETLVAIGELYQVPDEVLLYWLHHNSPSPALWGGHCKEYVEARRKVLEAGQKAAQQETLFDSKPASGFDPR